MKRDPVQRKEASEGSIGGGDRGGSQGEKRRFDLKEEKEGEELRVHREQRSQSISTW